MFDIEKEKNRISEQIKAAIKELELLQNVPKDNSIMQEMDRLKRLIDDLAEQMEQLKQEDFDEGLLDTEVENYDC